MHIMCIKGDRLAFLRLHLDHKDADFHFNISETIILGLITLTCHGERWAYGVLLTVYWGMWVHLVLEIGSSLILQFKALQESITPCFS